MMVVAEDRPVVIVSAADFLALPTSTSGPFFEAVRDKMLLTNVSTLDVYTGSPSSRGVVTPQKA
jgi:hypothetical protein